MERLLARCEGRSRAVEILFLELENGGTAGEIISHFKLLKTFGLINDKDKKHDTRSTYKSTCLISVNSIIYVFSRWRNSISTINPFSWKKDLTLNL